MSALPFEKWQGLGNDFVLVDGRDWAARGGDTDLVRAICDRHFGVGADGVLVIERDAPRMIVWNADGSRPEMCGNGLRCVAGFLAPARGSLALDVHTDAGLRRCAITRDDTSAEVAIEMGTATFGAPLALTLEGRPLVLATASMGNPHAITFEPLERAFFDRVAPVIERTPAGGTNVELVTVREGGFDVTVWERGVGYTLACGTGACAVAAVACKEGRASFGVPIEVVLPGGPLAITVDAQFGVTMRGPARRVFSGVWA